VGKSSEVVTTSASVPAAHLAFDGNEADSFSSITWGQVEEPGRGKVWTDSPSGDYANSADTAVTSKAVSLAGMSGSKLIFDAKYATEAKYDTVKAEVSADGGKTWATEATYSGSSDWKQQSVDLSKYDGKSIQFRFHLASDGSVADDGFSFANAVIAGGQ